MYLSIAAASSRDALPWDLSLKTSSPTLNLTSGAGFRFVAVEDFEPVKVLYFFRVREGFQSQLLVKRVWLLQQPSLLAQY